METFTVKDLTFTYPGKERPALNDVSLKVGYGEFIVLCGKSGCGKSTLLRNLKSVLTPHGTRKGCVEFYGRNIDSVTEREQAGRIGFVMQDPDSQIVTDKVWHDSENFDDEDHEKDHGAGAGESRTSACDKNKVRKKRRRDYIRDIQYIHGRHILCGCEQERRCYC